MILSSALIQKFSVWNSLVYACKNILRILETFKIQGKLDKNCIIHYSVSQTLEIKSLAKSYRGESLSQDKQLLNLTNIHSRHVYRFIKLISRLGQSWNNFSYFLFSDPIVM